MPRVVDHVLRRAAILDATCAVIARDGYDAATVREIAVEAGATTGLVTHYFESKDDVLVAALRRVHQAAGSRMLAAIDERSGREALDAAIEQALPLDDLRLDEWRVWLAFWGKASSNRSLQAEQRARYLEWSNLLGDLLVRASCTGGTDGLIALIDGIGLRAALDPQSLPPARQLELLADYIDRA